VQLTVAGATGNTYSSGWTAYTLSAMVEGQIVAHAVAATGQEPTSDLYTAALGGLEIENAGVTGTSGTGGVTQMPPTYQIELTQRLADHAELETPLSDATLQALYKTYQANFYTQVCVTQLSVSVVSRTGTVNFSASQAQAQTVAGQLASGGKPGGSVTCYTHEQLDQQPSPSLINTVVKLAPGQSTVQRTPFGYQVTAVTSRASLPLDGPVAKVLTTLEYDINQPSDDTVLRHLSADAKVRVDPGYGTWHPGSSSTLAGVVARSAPATAPVGSSGALVAGPLSS